MKNYDKDLLGKEIQEMNKLQGKERGADIKYLVNYVKIKEGENGLKALKIELAEQYNFFLPNFEKVVEVEWIPESIPHIFLVASVRFFNWNEKDVYEMGRSAISYSKTIKMFIRYFSSVKMTMQKAIGNWGEYYTEGSASLISFDKEKKEAQVEIKDFKTHPFVCIYLAGVFSKVAEITSGSKNVKVEEMKCIFKGDASHVFKLTW